MFHETADILHRSAATLQDFSGYRAATAWSAISLYAANLIAQPWRKEYRILRVSMYHIFHTLCIYFFYNVFVKLNFNFIDLQWILQI